MIKSISIVHRAKKRALTTETVVGVLNCTKVKVLDKKCFIRLVLSCFNFQKNPQKKFDLPESNNEV